MRKRLSILLTCTVLGFCPITVLADDLDMNGIVATVNGEPFTLRDLCKRLSPPRNLTMQQAAADTEAKAVLDQMIQEKLIEEEAKIRRIVVTPEEIDRYINELAERNNLSRKDFEEAFKKQRGRDIETFKEEVSAQILKSKLAGELVRGSSAVTDKEIDEYLKLHQELRQESGKIKLSQIVFFGHSKEALEKAENLREKLSESGDFIEAAKEYSESPDGKDGGSLGVMEEKDLDPAIFDAVFALRIGEISQVVKLESGYYIFRVDDRLSTEDDEGEKKIRTEIEQILKQEKLEARLRDYFKIDLFTNHFVDRKI